MGQGWSETASWRREVAAWGPILFCCAEDPFWAEFNLPEPDERPVYNMVARSNLTGIAESLQGLWEK